MWGGSSTPLSDYQNQTIQLARIDSHDQDAEESGRCCQSCQFQKSTASALKYASRMAALHSASLISGH